MSHHATHDGCRCCWNRRPRLGSWGCLPEAREQEGDNQVNLSVSFLSSSSCLAICSSLHVFPVPKNCLILFPQARSSEPRPSIWVKPACDRFMLSKGKTPAALSEYGKEVIGLVALAARRQLWVCACKVWLSTLHGLYETWEELLLNRCSPAARPQGLAATLSSSPFGTKCYHYCLEVAPYNVKDFQEKTLDITNTAITKHRVICMHLCRSPSPLLLCFDLQSLRQDGASRRRGG